VVTFLTGEKKNLRMKGGVAWKKVKNV